MEEFATATQVLTQVKFPIDDLAFPLLPGFGHFAPLPVRGWKRPIVAGLDRLMVVTMAGNPEANLRLSQKRNQPVETMCKILQIIEGNAETPQAHRASPPDLGS